MNRRQVIRKIKVVEPLLRARGVGALFLFGSYGRDQGGDESDIDIFVDPHDESLFELSNFMSAYSALKDIFPQMSLDFTTRGGLSDVVRPIVESEALQVF